MSAKAHMARLHELPCVVHKFVIGTPQLTATIVHHPESVRDVYSHFAGIPLCDDCHRELHKLSRRGFEARYKLTPIDMLAMTIKLMEST